MGPVDPQHASKQIVENFKHFLYQTINHSNIVYQKSINTKNKIKIINTNTQLSRVKRIFALTNEAEYANMKRPQVKLLKIKICLIKT